MKTLISSKFNKLYIVDKREQRAAELALKNKKNYITTTYEASNRIWFIISIKQVSIIFFFKLLCCFPQSLC